MKNKIIFFDIETISTQEAGENEKERYGDKLNFMPEFNQIFCIVCGYIDDKGENKILSLSNNNEVNEETIIRKFFDVIKSRKICGFNIKNFDIHFIIKRALKYGIAIPGDLKQYGKKPREMENIIDLFEIYRYGVFGANGNLDLCCKFLGITSPKEEGIEGSKVQEYIDAGKGTEVIDYCKRDVEATMKLYEYFKNYNLID